MSTLRDLIRSSKLVVTCGPGGVGKTTTAAAIGLAAAAEGRRVVVMTVDPARRLADALGIDLASHGHEPHEVVGVGENGGRLSALMLDAEITFDRMIVDNASSSQHAENILANPVYRSIAGALAGAQDYMAIERLHQLDASGEYDLIVVDTPPSRDAIDLLEAPDRLVTFFGHPIYRALTLPTRSFTRVTNAGTSAFTWVVRRLAGPRIVEDTIEFFRSLAGMEQGLRERAGEVAALLRHDDTSVIIVSSPRAEAVAESTHFAHAALESGIGFDSIVFNLVHPLPPPLESAVEQLAVGPLADHVAYHEDLTTLARSERDEMTALLDVAHDVGTPVVVTEVPLLEQDVHDLDGLHRLAEILFR